MITCSPFVIEGAYVRLEPLGFEHCSRLADVGCVEAVWRWMTTRFESEADIREFIETALQWHADGTAVPFATIDRTTGQPVGSTRFANIARDHRRVEIGWTWVAPPWQRTAVNTEAKYLMFRHAFEVWDCIRVELKTNAKNSQSRRAIERIGAKEEGTLRNHMINPDGTYRDTVYYSVISREWPEVKRSLERKLTSGS
jgi:RimJ/RimL family protein N-acetyltransferase